MIQEWNCIHFVDLSFYEKFAKYYHFSLHYRETVVENLPELFY